MAVIMWLMHADMTCTQWCSWGRGGGERMILRPRAAKIKYYTKKFDLLCSIYIYIYICCCCGTTSQHVPGTANFLRFLDHTQFHTHSQYELLWTSYQPVAEVANYKALNKHKKLTSKTVAEFEPATTAVKRLQTYVSDHTATRISIF